MLQRPWEPLFCLLTMSNEILHLTIKLSKLQKVFFIIIICAVLCYLCYILSSLGLSITQILQKNNQYWLCPIRFSALGQVLQDKFLSEENVHQVSVVLLSHTYRTVQELVAGNYQTQQAVLQTSEYILAAVTVSPRRDRYNGYSLN